MIVDTQTEYIQKQQQEKVFVIDLVGDILYTTSDMNYRLSILKTFEDERLINFLADPKNLTDLEKIIYEVP